MSEADRAAKNTNAELAADVNRSCDLEPTVEGSVQSGISAADAAATYTQPKSIGPYQLVRKLGEGGMGQVWLAEQTAPVKRNVALKLIKVGMYDGEVLQRFHSERQSIAMMDHPAIAKVFDAGATPDGQPYFVMEYVQGVPITQYCDQKRLTIAQRLELFIKVCEGVQHAHQKAIIHRDLKPANILVTEVDGKPGPRIIDFGIAKATGPEIGDETMMTRVGGFVGTPGYMSPEQADSTVQDVDTRTDVYSLGVVLYVLLAGEEPFDATKWKKQPVYEVLRQLREVDPPRPSTRIRSDKPSSTSRAENRGMQPSQLENVLHGDLDWITMKALEKDRARRYGAPTELAADIGRYIANEPILARPASTAYRIRKYVRRHRIAVAVASGLILLLAAFAVIQAVQVRRVTQERDRTARERDRANRITDFMLQIFKVSDPTESRGNTITARELLDKASKDIDTGMADPEVQAQMLHVMGEVYDNLGIQSRAQTLFSRAAETRRRVLGPNHPDTLDSLSLLSWEFYLDGRYAEAEKLQREALETQLRVLGPNDPRAIYSLNHLAGIVGDQGRFSEAEKLHRQALEAARRTLGPGSRQALITEANLAHDLNFENRYAEAETVMRDAVDLARKNLGEDNPDTLKIMSVLGWTLEEEKHYAEAEKIQRETLEIQRRVLGAEHPSTLLSMTRLAVVLQDERKYAEAKKVYSDTLSIQRRVLGPESADTALTVYNMGCLAALEGDQAFSLLRQAIDHGLFPSQDLQMEGDDALISLKSDARFTALLAHAKQVAQSKTALAQKTN